jgi:hypothetical protein
MTAGQLKQGSANIDLAVCRSNTRPASARGVTSPATRSGPSASERAADGQLQQRVANLEEELSLCKQKEVDTAQERDFYFSKLREIELLCQFEGVKQRWDIMQACSILLPEWRHKQ